MGTVGLCLAVLAAVLLLGYLGAPLIVWVAAAGAFLYFVGSPVWVMIVLAVPVLIFILPPLRAALVSRRLAGAFRKLGLLPAISETERVALDAGTVWMDAELFSGKPNLRRLVEQAYPTLSSDEQAFLDGPVEDVCRMTDDWRAWKEKDLPPEVWTFLKEHGFFGLIIPKEYGGKGFSASGTSAVIQKLASRSFALSVTVMIPNSLGPAELLSHYGTDAQKTEYLPKLASGEHMPCFALTEPGAGSDAGAIASDGVVFRDDDGQPCLRLSWTKRYTSLATVSTLIGLAFKLRDPENLLGRGESPGITCALVPTDTPGVRADHRHDPLGVPFHNCYIEGEDVIVSVDQIIGGAEGAGRGWRMLMECLSAGRGIALPASSVANAKMVGRATGAYSAVRHQFGLPVGKFEGIEEPLARITGYGYVMEAARRYTCGAVDGGEKPSVISAIMKYHLTELSRQLTNDGMDVMAGAGISRGPRNLLAASHVASPIAITVEGANILTRCMIIFGQGAMRCHPFAQRQIAALAENDMKAFDRALWGHVRHLTRNAFRAGLLSVTRGRLAFSPVSGPMAPYWRRLSWASASFALLADMAMISLGGNLKRCEKLTGRLGDILSWMYLGAATMRRFEADGRRDEDRPVAEWAMQAVFARIQEAFDGCFRNFPAPGLGGLLRGPVALWSRMNPIGSPPPDRLGSRVAQVFRRTGEQRERLADGLHLPSDPGQALGRLESALRLADESRPVVKKIKDAVREGKLTRGRPEHLIDAAREAGVIDDREASAFREALAARTDAIQVDSFDVGEYATASPTPGFDTEPASTTS